MRRLLVGLAVLVCLGSWVENCRADDPCADIEDNLLRAMEAMPKFSGEDFRQGQFTVTSAGKGHSLVKFTVRGKVRFKQKVADFNNYQAIKIGGLSALSFISREEGNWCCYCGYLVVPSFKTGRFMMLPSQNSMVPSWPSSWYNNLPPGRAEYYRDRNVLIDKFLYRPMLDGRPVEYLEHIDVKDFDGDGQLEIFTYEKPDWANNCSYSNAGRPTWKRIFHLLPEENRLEDVSSRFPAIYDEIAKGLEYSLEEDKSPRCVSNLTNMLNQAKRLAGQ